MIAFVVFVQIRFVVTVQKTTNTVIINGDVEYHCRIQHNQNLMRNNDKVKSRSVKRALKRCHEFMSEAVIE